LREIPNSIEIVFSANLETDLYIRSTDIIGILSRAFNFPVVINFGIIPILEEYTMPLLRG